MNSLVLFDGANFYNNSKRLAQKIHLTNFKCRQFCKQLTKQTMLDICYYVGEIKQSRRNKKSQKLYAAQQSLFSNLRKQDISIELGYLLKSSGVYHEKGTDVKIAVDLVVGSVKNIYDSFYLISSDTDLLPAVEVVLREGKEISYIGFEGNISKAMSKTCSNTIIVTKNQLQKFS